MSQANTILVYSTLSEKCRKLFEIIQPFQHEFTTLTGLRLLCIDSKKIRNIVTESKDVIIDKVPTILVLLKDGGVEMYDGLNCFKWVQNVISMYISPPSPKQNGIKYHQIENTEYQRPQEVMQSVTHELQSNETKHRPMSQSDNLQNPKQKLVEQRQLHELEMLKTQDPSRNMDVQQLRRKTTEIESEQSVTSINALYEDSPKQKVPKSKKETSLPSDTSEKIKRPPVGVRSDAGNYEFTTNFPDTDEDRSSVSLKKNSEKQANIMALAQALQKDREVEPDSSRRNVN